MKKNKKLSFIASLLFFSVLVGTVHAQDSEEEDLIIEENLQKNITIIEAQHPHELNPHITSYSSDAQLLSGLYEGLFTYDPVTLDPLPAIATSYRISRDKKRWTFTINPEACFSNGQKIRAQDIRDSWIRLLATPNAPYASLLDVIKGAADFRNGLVSQEEVAIYANTEESLSIHLVKAANYLPKLLCHSSFAIVYKEEGVYSGPFCLTNKTDKVYLLNKNPYYWDKDNVRLEEICFYQSDDPVENAFYFNTGYADWISGNTDTSLLYNKNAFSLSAEFGTSYIFFKNQNDPWDKVEFRSALLEAVPWDSLRKDYYVPATTFVYPLTGYPQVNGYSYTDIEEAKNLMSEAREKYNIPEEQKLVLTFEMPEEALNGDRLTALSDAWAQLGVELQIKAKKSYEYFNGVPESEADMFIYTWIGDFADPLAFLELFRGDSTLNNSKWKNSEYDSLIDQAAEVSEEERYKLLSQAESILLDDCMVIPIQHPVIYNIIDKEIIGGWSENAFDIHPLKYLYKRVESATVPNIVMLTPPLKN